MSGGSYDYLYMRTADELINYQDDIEDMRDRLHDLAAGDVAQVLNEVLDLIQSYSRAVNSRMYNIYSVLHAVEWLDSGDGCEGDFREALDEYRASRRIQERRNPQ